jgi:hypothetical protein
MLRKERETYASHSDILCTRVLEDLGQGALLLELKVHLRLVRLDLDEDVARCEGVACLLLPCADVARGPVAMFN